MKETHNSMDHLLSTVNYQEHKRLTCGDLKVAGLELRPSLDLQNTLAFCDSETAELTI